VHTRWVWGDVLLQKVTPAQNRIGERRKSQKSGRRKAGGRLSQKNNAIPREKRKMDLMAKNVVFPSGSLHWGEGCDKE